MSDYGYSQVFSVVKDIKKYWKVLIIGLITLIFVSGFEIYFPNFIRGVINTYIGGKIITVSEENITVYGPLDSIQQDLLENKGKKLIDYENSSYVRYSALNELSYEDRVELRREDLSSIKDSVKFIFILLLSYILIYFIHFFCINYIGQSVMYDLREKVFNKLLSFKMDYYIRTPAGVLVTRVTNDIEAINQFFSGVILTWLKDAVLILGIGFMMFKINARMFMALFIIFPVLIMFMIYFQKKLRDAYRIIRKKVSKMNAFIAENLAGMYIIKSFVKEKRQKNKFLKINEELYSAFEKQVLIHALFMPTVNVLKFFAISIVVVYGGYMIIRGQMLFGDIVAFFSYIELFFKPIRGIAEKFNMLQSAQAALERIFLILQDDKNIEIETGDKELYFEKEIEFKNVCFEYKKGEPVLENINFKVKASEKVAFVGHTGAGKTTIINLITNFYKIKSGDILIDGRSIYEYSLNNLRKNLAYVPQDVFIFTNTLRYNICFSESNQSFLDSINSKLELTPFFDKLENGVDTYMVERGNSLSYGEKQLIAFARSLFFNPAIIVLDEATANIDSNTEHLIQKAMENLLKGRTALIIAHRLSTIKNCDKIFVLNKGRIVEEGTHSQLLEMNGYYKKLYKLQYEES
ncbi:MAG: ABC transporter ATP-binding protein [Candidatus Muiribacteriota bacterium]